MKAQRSQHLWSNNNPSYTWRQVLHFPSSSLFSLPKCSVLPIFKSLELLNALLFTYFLSSRWVIYSMTWPLAWKGDGFKTCSLDTEEKLKGAEPRTCTSLPRLARPSRASKKCPVGKSVFSWCVNFSSQQMSLPVYDLGKSHFIKIKKLWAETYEGVWFQLTFEICLLACFLI